MMKSAGVMNVVHISASLAEADIEKALWFTPGRNPKLQTDGRVYLKIHQSAAILFRMTFA